MVDSFNPFSHIGRYKVMKIKNTKSIFFEEI